MSTTDQKVIAVLCTRYYDFQVWIYPKRNEKVSYIWVYNLDKVRGRKFDGIELLADWYALKDAEEIVSEINKQLKK